MTPSSRQSCPKITPTPWPKSAATTWRVTRFTCHAGNPLVALSSLSEIEILITVPVSGRCILFMAYHRESQQACSVSRDERPARTQPRAPAPPRTHRHEASDLDRESVAAWLPAP